MGRGKKNHIVYWGRNKDLRSLEFLCICYCFLNRMGNLSSCLAEKKSQRGKGQKSQGNTQTRRARIPSGQCGIDGTVEKPGPRERSGGSLFRNRRKKGIKSDNKEKIWCKGKLREALRIDVKQGVLPRFPMGSSEARSQETLETARIGQRRSSCSFKWNLTTRSCSM